MENLISVGNRIELKQILNQIKNTNEDVRNYVSQILDINDDTIQAAMPIYEGHLIPLEVGSKYDVFFRTDKGLYKAACEVVGRSKVEKIYMVELKPISEFEKYQRREFYRLETNLDATLYILSEVEMKDFLKAKTIPEDYINNTNQAVIIDISGGGVRAVSKEFYEKNSMVLVDFKLTVGAMIKNIIVLGKVVTSVTSNNRFDLHEHRIQFRKVPKETRELIIKYIFDEQRRIRQKERG